jgi:hypothetical protein
MLSLPDGQPLGRFAKRRVLLFYRNIYEQLASGYLYHKAGAEKWSVKPMSRMNWHSNPLDNMQPIYAHLRNQTKFPRPLASETYAQYLQRVSVG